MAWKLGVDDIKGRCGMGGTLGAENRWGLGAKMFHQIDPRQPHFGEYNFNSNPNSFVSSASMPSTASSRAHGMLIFHDPSSIISTDTKASQSTASLPCTFESLTQRPSNCPEFAVTDTPPKPTRSWRSLDGWSNPRELRLLIIIDRLNTVRKICLPTVGAVLVEVSTVYHLLYASL